MVGEAVAAAAAEKTADERIAECLAEGRSFVLDAGAGAGKTYSLVEGLKKLCAPMVADRLRRDGQQIGSITTTCFRSRASPTPDTTSWRASWRAVTPTSLSTSTKTPAKP